MAALESPIPSRFGDEPEWADELEQALTPPEGLEYRPPVPAAAERWSIQSAGAAEWAMRRLAELKAAEQEASDQADAWREPINRWENDQLNRLQGRIQFFCRHLEAYGLEQRRLHPKEATIRLPSGDIATRQQTAPSIDVEDEDEVIAWARGLHGDLREYVIKTTESVKVKELKRLVTTRATPEPWCSECGGRLEELAGAETDANPGWVHAGPAEQEWDHDAVPGHSYVVVYESGDGEVEVPGLVAFPPTTIATPKPR